MVKDTQVFDVAVIGAGPTGSFAAARMKRAGLNVVQLEKDNTPGDSTVCAGGLHRDVVEFVNISPEAIERRLRSFRVTTNGKPTDWNFDEDLYLMANRQNLDRTLSESSKEAGVTLITNARVTDVDHNEELLTYQSTTTGQSHEVKARVFIFADGVNSLGRQIFMKNPLYDKAEQAIGVEYDLEAPGENEYFNKVEVITCSKKLPFGYYWIFPKNGFINVGIGRSVASEGESLWKLLDEFIEQGPELCGRKIINKKGGIIPVKVSCLLQKQNCLFIGDAAGMVNPITGGGYVCGFVSSRIAADTIIEAYKLGTLDQTVLRKYSGRMKRTKHYVVIRSAYLLFYSFFLLNRTFGVAPYPSFFKFYTTVIHRLMPVASVL